jgi:hypothetical protein
MPSLNSVVLTPQEPALKRIATIHLRGSASNPRSVPQKDLLNCAELYHIAEPNETTESATRDQRRKKY